MTLVDYNLPVKIPQKLADARPELISQGAEALVFMLPQDNSVAKYRPPKPWRLPELDSQLRKRRTNQEARVLRKLSAAGVAVPELKEVDLESGLMYMQLISGQSLKAATWQHQTPEGEVPPIVRNFYEQLGTAVARMHALNVVHGDLTTSNAMITAENELVLIDFGLGSQDGNDEDKAVDLYVLERAIHSTHPREAADLVNNVFMPAYTATGREYPGRKVDLVLNRLENVRRRGRKRTQLG